MLAYGASMDTFISVFQKCIKSIIVKQSVKAEPFETAETKRLSDRYIMMMDGSLSWESVARFDRDVLLSVGMSRAVVDEAYTNKELIPLELRDLCLKLQKEKTISEYVEKNNYYRMLNGEPDYEDDNPVYMYANDQGIDTSIPVHELPEAEQDYINTSGIADKLLEMHPDKLYLKHLGSRSVDYYHARTALNYAIIYIERTPIYALNVAFGKYYANARNYVMKALYNPNDRDMYAEYDSFMGFNIMVMAINRTFASIFTQGITREFYDDSLIKSLYECFNITYENSIDVKYHREIAKRLNVLLQLKSSKQVIFDIISLFNYTRVNVYEYYLVKDVKKDAEGNPVFIYKTVVDEEGNVSKVIDPEKTYDIYFQKVNIKSDDPKMEMGVNANKLSYTTITGEDPYWIDDSDLLNKIYNTSFNAIATKYMSIDVAFDLAKIMYETCHIFRLILDKGDETQSIMVSIPYASEPVSLYDVVVFLCALVAKKFGLTGEIPLKPRNVATVYGFNFNTDLDKIREDIMDQIERNHGIYSHIDPNILSLITERRLRTIDDVEAMYEDIEKLRVFLDTGMRYTTDLDAYRAYEKLYKSLLITTDYDTVYRKPDGSLASTFMELLESRRPDLAEYVSDKEAPTISELNVSTFGIFNEGDINTKINRMLDVLSDISDNLENISFANSKNEIVNNIEKTINQFKSYTVDMQDSGIMYVVNDPHLCMLKILDWIKFNIGEKIDVDMLIEDVLHSFIVTRQYSDHISLSSKADLVMYQMTIIADSLKIWDKLILMLQTTIKDKEITLEDTLHRVFVDAVLPKAPLVVDTQWSWYEHITKIDNPIMFPDDVWSVIAEASLKHELDIGDTLQEKVAIACMMYMSIMDKIFLEGQIILKEPIDLIHNICTTKHIKFAKPLDIIDTVRSYMRMRLNQSINFVEWIHVAYTIPANDLLTIREELKVNSSTEHKMALDLVDVVSSISETKMNDTVRSFSDVFFDIAREYRQYIYLKEDISTIKNIERKMELSSEDILREEKDELLSKDLTFSRELYRKIVLDARSDFSLDDEYCITQKDETINKLVEIGDMMVSAADIKKDDSVELSEKQIYESVIERNETIELDDKLIGMKVNGIVKKEVTIDDRLEAKEKFELSECEVIKENQIYEGEMTFGQYLRAAHKMGITSNAKKNDSFEVRDELSVDKTLVISKAIGAVYWLDGSTEFIMGNNTVEGRRGDTVSIRDQLIIKYDNEGNENI